MIKISLSIKNQTFQQIYLLVIYKWLISPEICIFFGNAESCHSNQGYRCTFPGCNKYDLLFFDSFVEFLIGKVILMYI